MKAFVLFLFISLFLKPLPAQIDKQEAQKAYTLLNKIRTASALFTEEVPFLDEIAKKHPLKWNDT